MEHSMYLILPPDQLAPFVSEYGPFLSDVSDPAPPAVGTAAVGLDAGARGAAGAAGTGASGAVVAVPPAVAGTGGSAAGARGAAGTGASGAVVAGPSAVAGTGGSAAGARGAVVAVPPAVAGTGGSAAGARGAVVAGPSAVAGGGGDDTHSFYVSLGVWVRQTRGLSDVTEAMLKQCVVVTRDATGWQLRARTDSVVQNRRAIYRAIDDRLNQVLDDSQRMDNGRTLPFQGYVTLMSHVMGELLHTELKQIPDVGFSSLTPAMLSGCVKVTHDENGWGFSYLVSHVGALDRVAIGYALHTLLNHVLGQSVAFDLRLIRRVSQDDFLKLIQQLDSPAYRHAKRCLAFITSEPLSTGYKSWWEVYQAEKAWRAQDKPGRLSDGLYDELTVMSEDRLKTSVVPLLHTALLNLESNPNRVHWKEWFETLFVNLGFKDNKGGVKTFLTGNEQWRTILSEDQARQVSVLTDHVLWVMTKLTALTDDSDSLPDITSLYSAWVPDTDQQHGVIEDLMGVYDAQMGLAHVPFELPHARVSRMVALKVATNGPLSRPSLPPSIVSGDTPGWEGSWNQLRTQLGDASDGAFNAAFDMMGDLIRRHGESDGIPSILHAVVTKLGELGSSQRYEDAKASLKAQIITFHGDMGSNTCRTGLVGRLYALLQLLAMGEDRHDFVRAQLSHRLNQAIIRDPAMVGGTMETSMVAPFVASFLADKGWGVRPTHQIPYDMYIQNFRLIATRIWHDEWVTTTIMTAIYEYYHEKLDTCLRETQEVQPLVAILQQIDPAFDPAGLYGMYYPTDEVGDMVVNPAALRMFILAHVEGIACREGWVERRG